VQALPVKETLVAQVMQAAAVVAVVEVQAQ
jgi:hypothetical protein